MKLNFQKNRVVSRKIAFFVVGLIFTPHTICFNIVFWQGSLIWN